MAQGAPESDQVYELRYRLNRTDLLLVPVAAGMTLVGGWIVLGWIMNPAISLWQVLFPLAVVLVAGPFLLLIRLGWLVDARIALRVDSCGLLVEPPWPLWRGRPYRARWHDIATVELVRIRATTDILSPKFRRIRLWRNNGVRETVPPLFPVRGSWVDRSRLKAAVRYHAPHVCIVDKW